MRSDTSEVVVFCRDLGNDRPQRSFMIAAVFQLLERIDEIRRLGANDKLIGRAGMADAGDSEQAFVDERLSLPSERKADLCALRRHLELAVAVVESNVELVRLIAACLEQAHADEPVRDDGRELLILDRDFERWRQGGHAAPPPNLDLIASTTPPTLSVMPPTALPMALLAPSVMLFVKLSMDNMFFRSEMSPRPSKARTLSSERLSVIENSTRLVSPKPSSTVLVSESDRMVYEP